MDNWLILKDGIHNCKKIRCILSRNKKYKYNAYIYNRFYFNRNITKSKKVLNILCNLEALSRWNNVERIIYGNDKKFDILMSYRLLFSKHHISYTYYVDIDNIIKYANKTIGSVNNFMKRKNIIFIYNQPYKNRNKLCEMFNTKIEVDKYGNAFKDHLKWPKNIPNQKYLLIKNYKFCLAIENTINQVKWGQLHSDPIDDDYVTEKLWDCLKGGSIPIYFGAKNIKDFLPTNMSIINVNDFHNYSECIDYVKSILNNRKVLQKYIDWTAAYSNYWYKKMKYFSVTPCRICKRIHDA